MRQQICLLATILMLLTSWGVQARAKDVAMPVKAARAFKDVAMPVKAARAFKNVAMPVKAARAFKNVAMPVKAARAFKDVTMPVKAARAFKNLRFHLPVVITHAGDGSDRLFVAEQEGKVLVFPNQPDAKDAKVFLDIEDRVVYRERQNEEGLLGLAFHPDYKKNGEVYVYYTTADAPNTSVISRFKLSSDNAGHVDPKSEEELFRLKQPYWNHNGGTICFGPDGYLYVGLGDGGSGRDPHRNGQNLKTLLGSILRIDVNQKGKETRYAIPKDNPFVGRKDARGEIWAYGIRNVWRISFDRKTGHLWAGDVGQDLWEEINIITRGGNYGWNLREGNHPFGKKGAKANAKLIDPIWEYNHTIGKSITGGHVYRGKALPELTGKYIYADYVTGLIWALDYDEQKKKVRANYSLGSPKLPVMTFGEDQAGEVYFATRGGSIYGFQKSSK